MSRSREGAWIEMLEELAALHEIIVAPVRERGLKSEYRLYKGWGIYRSREGAWIEIFLKLAMLVLIMLAPVRERGLKCSVSQGA